MHQAIAFIDIRVRQAVREVLRAGPVYGLLLILAIFGAFAFFYYSQKSNHFIIYTYTGLLVLLAMVHLQRSDHRFINLFGVKPFIIYFSEYVAVLIPFFILTLIKTGQIFQLLIIIPVAALCFLKIGITRTQASGFPVFFTGTWNFEWKAGLRRTGWIMVILWLVALLLTPVPYASLLPLWFMLLNVSSFYEGDESRRMVEAYEVDERKYLWMKIKSHALLFCLIVMPVLLVSAIFFPANWWTSLFFICFSVLNFAVFIVSKYAVWEPGESHGSVTFINTFCLIGFFLPFLLPLPIFVFIRNYFKAKYHLKPVLHAYTK